MNITIINDCRDANAAGRQMTRVGSLFNKNATVVGVETDLEAAGNLIDALDAIDEKEGVILVNVAPRDGDAKKWKNGTPFGYFWYQGVLVVASVDGLTLSFVKKLKLVDELMIMDIPTALKAMIKHKYLPDKLKDRISITQFRSYNFLPRIAHYLWDKKDVVGEKWSLYEVPEVPEAIWWVDSFGNCKTTLFSDEIGFEDKKKIQTNLGKLTCYKSLKDVPDKQAALIVGSSGLGQKRFIELVVQGGRAAGAFNLRVRDEVKIVNK